MFFLSIFLSALGVQGSHWSDAANTSIGHKDAPMVTLKDGRVLILGSSDWEESAMTEIWDPEVKTWFPGPPMTYKRLRPAATLLTDGSVMVTGGDVVSPTDPHHTDADLSRTVEILDPASGKWTLTGEMKHGRSGHCMVALADGGALVMGSGPWENYGDTTNTVERWDPASRQWKLVAPLNSGRSSCQAVTLADGNVLVATPTVSGFAIQRRETEIYNPSNNSWSPGPLTNQERYSFAMVALQNGSFIVAGGVISNQEVASVEMYMPETNTFVPIDPMPQNRSHFAGALLHDGSVIFAGEINLRTTTTIWNPQGGYRCVDNQCVLVPGRPGIPKASCEFSCGRR